MTKPQKHWLSMRKIALFLVFFLLAGAQAASKIEIYATKLDTHGDKVYASGGVSVIYKDYFLTAKSAVYDRKSADLELYDDIRVNYQGKYKLLGKYARLNIAKKERTFKPFYMLDTASEVWMSAKEAAAKEENIEISKGMVSGCNPVDPLWKIAFSSSDYNAKSKWINIYNARFYFYDIPVFYTPYFGYSLDTTRRTGFLMPSVGFSTTEGVYYSQPLYIAEQNWWDLEIRPQIRTSRGVGGYSTFRFVDSKVSSGNLNMGYFKEYSSYFNSEGISLKNQQHYGFNFDYKNTDVLNEWFGTSLGGESGLYVEVGQMNDVEYINLETNDAQHQVTSNQVLSRINSFYNTDHHYYGAYVKYYQNLEQENNDNVLQQLPALQYHYYLNTLLKDHLLYSLDAQTKNIYRKVGMGVVQTDINLPVTLQGNFFDEYLNLSYKANIYMQHSKFQNHGSASSVFEYEDGYYVRNFHTLSASTELTKGYDSFIHVIGLAARYNKFAKSVEKGYYEYCSDPLNENNTECEFYKINKINEEAYFDFIQYFYDEKAEEFIYHRLSQKVSYEANQDRLGELENELDYKVTKAFSLYNNMFYNYQKNRFTKIFNSVRYNDYGIKLDLSYLYKYDIAKESAGEDPYTKYLTSSVNYDYNKHYSFLGVYNYDVELAKKKMAVVGFMYKKRCWDFGIKYSENTRPILDAQGNPSFENDRYLYVSIVLKPFMQPDPNNALIEYKLPKRE